jgi:hypothetical protein
MLRRISRFATSFAALLSDGRTSTFIDAEDQIEKIQEAMRACLLAQVSNESALPKIFFDVGRAVEVQTLWYLRSDLFGLLSAYCGEQAAQKELGVITEMFRGIIPNDQMPNRRRIER